jgi:hypothetical protein
MTKENKEMKSRFTYGMFAGFALAFVVFFLFFLFFFPSAFRAVTAKNPSGYQSAVSVPASLATAAPEPSNGYYDGKYVTYYAPHSPYGSQPLVSAPDAYRREPARVSPDHYVSGIVPYSQPKSTIPNYHHPEYRSPVYAPACPAV